MTANSQERMLSGSRRSKKTRVTTATTSNVRISPTIRSKRSLSVFLTSLERVPGRRHRIDSWRGAPASRIQHFGSLQVQALSLGQDRHPVAESPLARFFDQPPARVAGRFEGHGERLEVHREHSLRSQSLEGDQGLFRVHVVSAEPGKDGPRDREDCEVEVEAATDFSEHRLIQSGVACEVDAARTGQHVALMTGGVQEG